MSASPTPTHFLIDKSDFIRTWWDLGFHSQYALLKAPTGFGKTWLLHLIQDFFDKNGEGVGALKSAMVMADQAFVSANFRRYRVLFVDFGSFLGDTHEAAQTAFGARPHMTGGEYFRELTATETDSFILLIDNLDFPMLLGYLNDFQEEAIEFVTGFLEAMSGCKRIMRCLMTASLGLFLKDVTAMLPYGCFTADIYHGIFGQYLGFTVDAVRMIKESCREQIDASVTYTGLQRKFGGYYTGAPNSIELMHPLGVIPVCEILHSSQDFKVLAAVNSFSDRMPLLTTLFRKMDIEYLKLIKLIHSLDSLDIHRASGQNSSEDSLAAGQTTYGFIDFVLVLHDLGLLTKRGAGSNFSIANADAMMALMRLCDAFMTERIPMFAEADAELDEILEYDINDPMYE